MTLPPLNDPTLTEIVISISGVLISLLGAAVLFFLSGLYKELKMCAAGLIIVKRDIAVIRSVMSNQGFKHHFQEDSQN